MIDKQKAFHEKINSEPKLRKACDVQIAQFTRLGYLLRRGFFGRKFLNESYGPSHIIEFVPHVVAPLGILLVPYLKERQLDKGQHYARHFIGLSIQCVSLMYKPGIKIRSDSWEVIHTFGEKELTQARKQLEELYDNAKNV